ncbi:hypothetical protein Bca101_019556 [Brassica carinata]
MNQMMEAWKQVPDLSEVVSIFEHLMFPTFAMYAVRRMCLIKERMKLLSLLLVEFTVRHVAEPREVEKDLTNKVNQNILQGLYTRER